MMNIRIPAMACVWIALCLSTTLADDKPPLAAISGPDASARLLAPSKTKRSGPSTDSTGGWWMGSAGIVAALAVVGGISLASKRFLPSRDSGPMQVVGRSALSPKQSVYLLRVGDRVLILGTGPQGAPSMLGEITDPAELARLAPRRVSRIISEPTVPTRFDRRIGDDE